MKSAASLVLIHKPSQVTKPNISSVSERLTSSEIEQLRQKKLSYIAYGLKAFSKDWVSKA